MSRLGKKLTVAQMNALSKAGIPEPEDWLMTKEKQISDDGSKKLSKGASKRKYYVITNKETGEVKEVEIDG